MKATTRILLLVLSLCLVVGTLAACGGDTQPENPTTEAPSTNTAAPSDNTTSEEATSEDITVSEEGTTVETDEYGQDVIDDTKLDELNFGGAEVIFCTRANDRYRREFEPEEAERKDNVDLHVYNRNRAIEARLNVEIKVESPIWHAEYDDKADTTVQTAFLTGTHVYDVFAGWCCKMLNTTTRDCYVDLLDGSFTSIDISQNYWNQAYIDNAVVQGHLYTVVGDMSLSVWDRAMVVYTNQTLAKTYGYNNLVQEALDGNWTLARMNQIIADFGVIDGDGDPNTNSWDDTLALVSVRGSEARDTLALTFGIHLVELGTDNYFRMTAYTQQMEDACTKLKQMYANPGVYFTDAEYDAPMQTSFANGKSLFCLDVLCRNDAAMEAVRSMTDKYNVLPVPKYEASQPQYRTGSQDAFNSMAILAWTGLDREAVGATMEALNSMSYSDVRPYYLERVLKVKLSDSPESFELLGIILDNMDFETGAIYGPLMFSPVYYIWRLAFDKDQTIAERYDIRYSSITDAIDEFNLWMTIN